VHDATPYALQNEHNPVNDEPQTFFSSTAECASDGAVLIALFNGGRECVGIFRCSMDAALNLIGNIAASMVNGDDGATSDA
jgi:hypothetical protein